MDILKNHLEMVAKSYDRDIEEHGRNDALSYSYDNLPDYITNDPDYLKWKAELEPEPWKIEVKKEIKDYLSPYKDMKFIQLGCSLNLMFKGYDKWPSKYYGLDISSKTIQLLNDYIAKNNISVGSLHCGSIHETPYANDYFDIGECIGVLEYYDKSFVEKAIVEIHRIMKHNGKFVLDIPNITSPSGRVMMLIEECLGRNEKFNMLPDEFENMLKNYFEIEDSSGIDTKSMCIVYFLTCKK